MPKKSPQKSLANRNLAQLTLLEWVLLTIVVLVSGIAVVFSLDPTRRLNEASNARRFSDVTAILDEITDYRKKTGELMPAIQTLDAEQAYVLGSCNSGAVCAAVPVAPACLTLENLKELPLDPEFGTVQQSGYYLVLHENEEVTVGACSPDREGMSGDGPIPAINLRD